MKAWMSVRLGVAIASLLSASAVAGAQGSPGGPGFGEHRPPFERALGPEGRQGRWWNNPAMVEKLKLTDAQRKEMDQILLQHRETLIDLRGGVEKAELELEPLMRLDQPNEAKILAQIDKVAQARAELEKANARFLLAIRGKLTPEQWTALQQFKSERANRGGQRPGWGARAQRPGNGNPGGLYRHQAPPPPPLPPPPPQGAGPQGRMDDGSELPGPPAAGAEQ